ncbi:hypothetical protein [Marinomonas atlantica]|uniref:hypothetical protein n=1 Tax=Marinomonas atlantica TaxID=1806668 RepID=UPI00082DB0EC|nr:hypothetical protein [Marinomonas atlantica]MCO4787244.1 hypothetical protein [Marinomonas atlantica]
MTRILLLIPLLVLFSISAKAFDDNLDHSFVKSGLLEAPFELPSAEVTPDLDHTLLPIARTKLSESEAKPLYYFAPTNVSNFAYTLSCRDPPFVA